MDGGCADAGVLGVDIAAEGLDELAVPYRLAPPSLWNTAPRPKGLQAQQNRQHHEVPAARARLCKTAPRRALRWRSGELERASLRRVGLEGRCQRSPVFTADSTCRAGRRTGSWRDVPE